MDKYDLDVFEYRRQKLVKFTDLIIAAQLKNDYEKISLRTGSCGYVDAYIYRPEGCSESEQLKTVFMFHGGGMVLQYPEQESEYCRRLADRTHRAIVNLDYPVAPEFKYPKPIYACYELLHMVDQKKEKWSIDTSKMILLGSSAGATLAADMCVLNHTGKLVDIDGLVLNYGVYHQTMNASERRAVNPSKAIAPSRMEQYMHWYFNDLSMMEESLASPINADAECFPKSLIIGASLDSLLPDSIAMHQKLKNSELWIAPNTMHGFTHRWFKEFDAEKAEIAWDKITEYINSHN